MTTKIQALFGLKWNPFSPDVPIEGQMTTPRIDAHCNRVESLVLDGGFAMITGAPGSGKSAVMRLLADQIARCFVLHVDRVESWSCSLRALGSRRGHSGMGGTESSHWSSTAASRSEILRVCSGAMVV